MGRRGDGYADLGLLPEHSVLRIALSHIEMFGSWNSALFNPWVYVNVSPMCDVYFWSGD